MSPAASRAADEWAIRQLVERYASAADNREGEAAAALFTADGGFEMWMTPGAGESTYLRTGRTEIAAAINSIRHWDATHHVIANSAAEIDGDTARSRTQCVAHHLKDGTDEVMFIRYLDDLARTDGEWLITRRELHVQWKSRQPVETR